MSQQAKATETAIEQRRLRLWLRMLRTTRTTEAHLREFLRENFDTTLPRFDVLAALYRSPHDLKMNELSKQLLVSNGNVTGIVERLVVDGLVIRVIVEGDKRAMRVRLTPHGREKFSEMADGHKTLVNELFNGLDHSDLDALANVFGRLKEQE